MYVFYIRRENIDWFEIACSLHLNHFIFLYERTKRTHSIHSSVVFVTATCFGITVPYLGNSNTEFEY